MRCLWPLIPGLASSNAVLPYRSLLVVGRLYRSPPHCYKYLILRTLAPGCSISLDWACLPNKTIYLELFLNYDVVCDAASTLRQPLMQRLAQGKRYHLIALLAPSVLPRASLLRLSEPIAMHGMIRYFSRFIHRTTSGPSSRSTFLFSSSPIHRAAATVSKGRSRSCFNLSFIDPCMLPL